MYVCAYILHMCTEFIVMIQVMLPSSSNNCRPSNSLTLEFRGKFMNSLLFLLIRCQSYPTSVGMENEDPLTHWKQCFIKFDLSRFYSNVYQCGNIFFPIFISCIIQVFVWLCSSSTFRIDDCIFIAFNFKRSSNLHIT